MKENFQASLAAVLKSEGGNDDDPADHGGRTSRGITQREYDAWRKEKGEPTLDVWTAPQSDVETIYHDEYWEPYCDNLAVGVDYIYFNTCVLAGPHRAMLLLQKAVGAVADGRIGPITRNAIAATDAKTLIARFSAASRQFYLELHQPKFTQGWLNRVAFVQQTAMAMVKS